MYIYYKEKFHVNHFWELKDELRIPTDSCEISFSFTNSEPNALWVKCFCDGNLINIEKADFSMRIQMKLY